MEAQNHIEMVVEGVYACLSALQLAKENDVPMPIAETVYEIIYNHMSPLEAVRQLMQRSIKEEHL
jgi:glycerol-3-phosphate dehydrogenase (NAD(P)+)